MSPVSHVCIHPWAAEGVEGGLRLHIGERVILQRSEGDWGMVNKQDSPKVGGKYAFLLRKMIGVEF